MRMHDEFSKPPIEGVHRRKSCRVSIAADFPRHINQRNDDGKCADDLADCTNRFPIHGMIHVTATIQSHSAMRRKACTNVRGCDIGHPPQASRLNEITRVLVRLDHVASVVVNANLQRLWRRIQNADVTRTRRQGYESTAGMST